MNYKFLNITKYSQSAFRIEYKSRAIYIDPFRIPDNTPKADAIFITHEHFDHCSAQDLQKILKIDTAIYGNSLVKDRLVKDGLVITDLNYNLINPESEFSNDLNDFKFKVQCVPAYNLNKFHPTGRLYHPIEIDAVGYVLTFEDEKDKVRIFHMGDTDFLPADHKIENLDILMIPVSGEYVMTSAEAVQAVNEIMPKIAIPMHYDTEIIGSIEDAEYLKANSNTKVEILQALY